jgi:hypothetical protein
MPTPSLTFSAVMRAQFIDLAFDLLAASDLLLQHTDLSKSSRDPELLSEDTRPDSSLTGRV